MSGPGARHPLAVFHCPECEAGYALAEAMRLRTCPRCGSPLPDIWRAGAAQAAGKNAGRPAGDRGDALRRLLSEALGFVYLELESIVESGSVAERIADGDFAPAAGTLEDFLKPEAERALGLIRRIEAEGIRLPDDDRPAWLTEIIKGERQL